MKTLSERLKVRLAKNRPMTTINIRLPEDVIDDLKEIAPALGYSGYQPLIRAYLGQGLRKHLAELSHSPMQAVAESLRKQGISDQVIADATHAAAPPRSRRLGKRYTCYSSLQRSNASFDQLHMGASRLRRDCLWQRGMPGWVHP